MNTTTKSEPEYKLYWKLTYKVFHADESGKHCFLKLSDAVFVDKDRAIDQLMKWNCDDPKWAYAAVYWERVSYPDTVKELTTGQIVPGFQRGIYHHVS